MAAWSEHEFALEQKQDDGSTLRQHLLTVEKATGERHPWLERVLDRPTALMYLFEAFLDLSASRPPVFSGIAPISEAQLYYWQKVRQFPLRLWELEAIRQVDMKFRMVHSEGYAGPVEDDDGN